MTDEDTKTTDEVSEPTQSSNDIPEQSEPESEPQTEVVAPESSPEPKDEPLVSDNDESTETEPAQEPAESLADDDTPKAPIVEQTLTRAEQYLQITAGMTIRVHQKIKDVNSKGEEKERIQVFEGMVLARKHGSEAGSSFTVRKITNGVGVEKIFPLNLPAIEKIEIVKQARIRQSRPYFLRRYKKRLKEKRIEQMLTPVQ